MKNTKPLEVCKYCSRRKVTLTDGVMHCQFHNPDGTETGIETETMHVVAAHEAVLETIAGVIGGLK